MIIRPTINRSGLLVIPKQDFYDWSTTALADSSPTRMEEVTDYNTYLLEDELFLNDPKKELKKYWKAIFKNELFGHCTDESTYPKLSWNLFTLWFDFYKSSIIHDLTVDPLYIEHYE